MLLAQKPAKKLEIYTPQDNAVRSPKFQLNREVISGLTVKACELRKVAFKIKTPLLISG